MKPSHDQAERTEAATTSLWMSAPVPRQADLLPETTSIDVCVIGGGIAGLTTAYECLSRGMSVVIVESGTIGGGETLRTSAHLANALDDRFTTLRRLHGERGAKLLASAHGDAIAWISALCLAEDIDCGFARVPGYLFGREGGTRDDMEKELEACIDAGLDATLDDAPPLSTMGALPAIRFADQAEIHIGKYLAGLATAVVRKRGRIFEGVHIERVDEEPVANGRATVVARDGRKIMASHVVVATNPPFTSMASVPLRQAAYRSYVITLEIHPDVSIPHGLYWDMEEPYHYVRLAKGDRPGEALLIVGGEDHKTGQEPLPEASFMRLEQWARSRFPFVGAVVHRWSGQIMEPADGVGFVGKHPGSAADVYVISGDSGNGLTLATVGARIVADLMQGKSSPYRDVFDPSRMMLRAAGTLLSENANVAAQYADLVSAGEVASPADIANGQGAIVREGLSLLAVYRDEAGECHTRSALCPHLGGVVHWNNVEHSWDCPCHGSRFDAYGHVITGPASRDLDFAREPRDEG